MERIQNPFTAFFAEVCVNCMLIYVFERSIQFISRSYEVGAVVRAKLDGRAPNGQEPSYTGSEVGRAQNGEEPT